MIRQADDNVAGTPNDAQKLIEPLSNIGQVLDHLERHHAID